MKSLFSIMLTMIMYICMLAPASVANAADFEDKIPIVTVENSMFGGDESVIGYGRNIDGTIYVPLRLLFEATSAEVDYQPTTKVITIIRADGAAITIGVDSQRAEFSHLGQKETLTMSDAVHLLQGTTYVPIRFAAENLMCRVEWDNLAKQVVLKEYFAGGKVDEQRYVVDFGSETVYELDTDGAVKLLGYIPGIGAQYEEIAGWGYSWQVYDVVKSAAGSYLVRLSGIYMDSPTFCYMELLLTEHDVANRSKYQYGGLSTAFFGENSVWWQTGDKVQQFAEDNGKLLAEYDCNDFLAALPGGESASCCFCDGDYLLLDYKLAQYEASFPALVNLQTKEVTDLFTELIPETERKDFYYDGPGSSLKFVRAENGTLYFVYQKIVYGEHNFEWQEQEIAYQYR